MALLAAMGGMGGSGAAAQAAAPVQDNSADVQLMEDIFGTSLDYGNSAAKAAHGGSVDELLQLLRG